MGTRKKLIGVLGLGQRQKDGSFMYQETTYSYQGQTLTTRWVGLALSVFFKPDEIVLLATQKAEDTHKKALSDDFRTHGLAEPQWIRMPDGKSENELWEQFGLIKNELRAGTDTSVILDITHGFRSQPFFMGAAIAFVRGVDEKPANMRVVYGAFEARNDENITPIWDLTPMVELLDWGRGLHLFLQTGRAEWVAETAKTAGARAQKDWYINGRNGDKPYLNEFGKALKEFSMDLMTVRTGKILTGCSGKPIEKRETGSAELVMRTLKQAEPYIQQHLLPLSDILDRVHTMVKPLITDRMDTVDGIRALLALVRLYLDLKRYSEAAALLRETWVSWTALRTRFPKYEKALWAGCTAFDTQIRRHAEEIWQEQDTREVSGARNDMQHAGFRPGPSGSQALVDTINRLYHKLLKEVESKTVFVNISNHPSEKWDEKQILAAKEYADTIIDIPFPQVVPDLGTSEIEDLAGQVLDKLPANTRAAMVSGEFVLTTVLVRELQKRGITCVAATTTRKVREEGNKKITIFDFVRFREYPWLG